MSVPGWGCQMWVCPCGYQITAAIYASIYPIAGSDNGSDLVMPGEGVTLEHGMRYTCGWVLLV